MRHILNEMKERQHGSVNTQASKWLYALRAMTMSGVQGQQLLL